MDFAPYAGAITSVADLVSGVVKRIFPEKMSESEAAQLNQALTTELLRQDWSKVEREFQDRADARALAKADVDKGNWFTNILSATVRPVFGYAAMTAFLTPLMVRMVATYWTGHQQPEFTFTEIEKEVILSVIYFFFGGRTVEKGVKMWTDYKRATTK